jgi:hypothetical protein
LSPLSQPPADLHGFPYRTLKPAHPLVRIHLRSRGPWFFCADGSGRFDLTDPPGLGTCYLAERPLGAFVEVFRDTVLVDEADVIKRQVSRLSAPHAVKLANCTSRRARRFGVTGSIHSTQDYDLSQRWAAAFRGAGFGGVRYLVSHNPAQKLVGIALFGPAGEPTNPVLRSDGIDPKLVALAERRFGIKVRPTP